MPQRLRIFISSPADVPDERLRAGLIVDKLSQDYSRFFTIEAYRWEHEAMLASKHFQDAIEPPSAFDIVILILWSRLGTPLPEKTAERNYRGIDGRVPVTGTEWEYEEALKVARDKGAPDLLAFRNVSPPRVDPLDPEPDISQLTALNSFWRRHFEDRGVFLAAYAEYKTLEEFAGRLEESLRKLVERRIKALAVGAAALPIWTGDPFRGLEAYEFEHAPIFFGRDVAITKAAAQLAANARAGRAFLLISGASGSGKSSLVKAGVVPRLMKPQRISGLAFVRRCVFRPSLEGGDIVLGLARALARGGQDVGLPELLASGQHEAQLASHLRTAASDPGYLFANALGRLTEAERKSGRLLAFEEARLILVVDQLEELFTIPGVPPEDRRLLVQLLAGLARSGVVWVIATVRADLWHRVAEIPELIALAEGLGRIDLDAASPAELAEMIRKPAQAAGLSFEIHPETGLGLDMVLAEHAALAPGALPLLSFTLYELYKDARARGSSVLTHASYEALGGLEGAIANRADEIVAGLPPAAQAALPRVLRALTTVSETPEQVPVARSALLANFAEGSPARSLVDAFIAARLLVAGGGSGGPASVRLAHEALIGRWKRARDQLAADRRDLETRALVERQFARWREARGGERRLLFLRNPDLANAIDLTNRWGDDLDVPTRHFISQSARRARLAQTLTAAAAVVFALVAVGAVYAERQATFQKERAQTATAEAVKAGARAVESEKQALTSKRATVESEMNYRAATAQQLASAGHTQLAAAIALDAFDVAQKQQASPTPQLDAAIHRTLNSVSEPTAERFIGENVFNLAMSPDGRTLVAGTVKGMVYVLDPTTLALRFELRTGNDVSSGLDFSPDGERLVVAGEIIPSVWEAKTGHRLFELQRPDARKFTVRAQFSPNGKLIGVGSAENRAFIYDADTGALLHVLPGASFEEMRDRLRATMASDDFGIADPIVNAVSEVNFRLFGAATDAVFSPDGKIVAVTGPATPDGSVRLFDAETGELLKTLSGGYGSLFVPALGYGQTLSFSSDGSSVIAVALQKVIKVWNVTDGQLRAEFRSSARADINSFVPTADGAGVITAQTSGSLIFRCLANSAVISLQAHEDAIDSLMPDRHGMLFATGSSDRTARVWRMPTGTQICDSDTTISTLRPISILTGHGARVSKALLSDDDRTLTTSSQDGWVRRWTIGPGADSVSFKPPTPRDSFASPPDLLPAGDDADSNSSKPPTPEGSFASLRNLLAAGDGRTVFAYDGEDDRWRAWQADTGQPTDIPDSVAAIAPGDGHHGPILFQSPVSHFALGDPLPKQDDLQLSSLSLWAGPVSADGSRAVADEDAVNKKPDDGARPPDWTDEKHAKAPSVLIDSDTKQILSRLVADGRNAADLFFSPDGGRLFGRLDASTKEDGKNPGAGLAAWDSRSGKLLGFVRAIDGYGQSVRTDVSRNGARILVGPTALFEVAADGLKAVDIPKAVESPDFVSSSERSVTSTTLSADGAYLAVGRRDGTIVLADIDRNHLWRVLDTNGRAIRTMTMSDDGNYLAAVDNTDTLWVFTKTGELVRSETFPGEIHSAEFLTGTGRLAVLDSTGLWSIPALPAFAGRSDTPSMVESARRLGLNLVSDEDVRRYRLGNDTETDKPKCQKWAAINPNSEGTADVVCADTETEARANAVADCKRSGSTTCASKPAVTSNLDNTFVYYCCTSPRLGCAMSPGSGFQALLSVKESLAKAKYSNCEVRKAYSARDGRPR